MSAISAKSNAKKPAGSASTSPIQHQEGQPPLIVAELSGNHQGKLEQAIELMDLAHSCGADMIKIQTYTEDSLTIPSDRPEREKGIFLFSSPFCPDDVDVLEKAGCPVYKIASFEVNYPQLIAYCAQTGKPIVMSTGLATLEEIDKAVAVARDNGCKDLTLLHCESHYPADPRTFNLNTIPFFKERYQCKVGLSNHAIGDALDIAATALGADMIEKHFAKDRHSGIDAAFSMTPDELRQLKQDTVTVALSMGQKEVRLSEDDIAARSGRRSVYLTSELKQGEALTMEHVRIIRPACGLDPFALELLLGKKAKSDLHAGTPLQASDFQ